MHRSILCSLALSLAAVPAARAADRPPPRVESVVPADRQPWSADPAVIFYDNFDGPDNTQAVYMEPAPDSPHAARSRDHALGRAGMAMELTYPPGKSDGVGNRKLVFGDSPAGRPVRRGERFDEVYWRVYVKHQPGWRGDPFKMSRATGLTSARWAQAFILHVWGGGGDVLTLDPVRCVRDGRVTTTRYNDFPNFARWLGNAPKGTFPVHSTAEAGRWVCVEAHLKLNAPGKQDGEAHLWVDGRLDAERAGMDFRGTYTGHAINAVFLEAYWNGGSPVEQKRWYDDFVVSTKPIGPVVAAANPVLLKRPSDGATAWQVEVRPNRAGSKTVWEGRSSPAGGRDDRLTVDAATGTFAGELAGKASLPPGEYVARCREQVPDGTWTDWSPWHQPFAVR